MNSKSQQGVALVITLIMLSIITVIAVAFLALSRRERASVSHAVNQTDAELMAEIALERAKGMVVAEIMAATNLLGPDLLVSRNYINPLGFTPAPPFSPASVSATNVNYDYLINNGGPLNNDHFKQTIANLYWDPRPPVFVRTNRATDPLEFRYFLDLNRNRRFEESGWLEDLNDAGVPYPNPNGTGNYFTNFLGDPQWIGVLERPSRPGGPILFHSSSNKFIGRYSFIVLPVGKSLDINFIHNHVKKLVRMPLNGYLRNQGFGSWEINLAAFLAELNTNYWNRAGQFPLHVGPPMPVLPYNYNLNPGSESMGTAFNDAREFLSFRYNANEANLAPAELTLPFDIWDNFERDLIDGYGNGPINPYGQGLAPVPGDEISDRASSPWAGSTNLASFFSVHDFFDRSKPNAPVNFIDRMAAASAQLSTSNRYTFYRLLSQLSMDTAADAETAEIPELIQKMSAEYPTNFPAEPIGRINLNYDNVGQAPANHWEPLKFFTNVANVLLSQFNIGSSNNPYYLRLGNIPVFPTNYYTPAVHRVLQVAANIYDGSTNDPFPSVFRPLFSPPNASGEVFITGYINDTLANTINAFAPTSVETYGVPPIVGAKKGIPNFNEYVAQSTVQASRKLELRRPNTNSPPNQISQMFILSVSNFFGLESWNAYTQAYPNWRLQIWNDIHVCVTNSSGFLTNIFLSPAPIDITQASPGQGPWTGYRDYPHYKGGFKIPLTNSLIALKDAVYRVNPQPHFDPVGTNLFETGVNLATPEWWLCISNRLTYVLSADNKILDFVHLRHLDTSLNITAALMGSGVQVAYEPLAIARCWDTNRTVTALGLFEPTEGIKVQMRISLGEEPSNPDWTGYSNPAVQDKPLSIRKFRAFIYPNLFTTNQTTDLVMQAPFSPSRKVVHTATWQANDPLVHHLVEHLKDVTNNVKVETVRPLAPIATNLLGSVNERYRPWKFGTNDITITDPGMFKSDDWVFPNHKYPSIGWLGRVHRGTPWQTIYLKSAAAPANVWLKNFLDMRAHPTNDWRLIDMFTVAVHPNAARGLLSVNQTNMAAWAAVVCGVPLLANPTVAPSVPSGGYINTHVDAFIQPGSPELTNLVYAIDRVRGWTNNAQTGLLERKDDPTFRRVGEILAVPELTVKSPFINLTNEFSAAEAEVFGINDILVERLPEQILSLLKVGDSRFVVYAYGQALKPADRSIVTSGPFFGMCTNYQITGEVLTRSVLQIEGTADRPKTVLKQFNILSTD